MVRGRGGRGEERALRIDDSISLDRAAFRKPCLLVRGPQTASGPRRGEGSCCSTRAETSTRSSRNRRRTYVIRSSASFHFSAFGPRCESSTSAMNARCAPRLSKKHYFGHGRNSLSRSLSHPEFECALVLAANTQPPLSSAEVVVRYGEIRQGFAKFEFAAVQRSSAICRDHRQGWSPGRPKLRQRSKYRNET